MKGKIVMKRFVLMAIMLATIIFGGVGCVFTNNSNQDVNNLALEHLEQKYGEKFIYDSPCGSSITGTRSFLATCESLDNFKVLVQIENYKDENNRVFCDNYLSGKYEKQTYEYFKGIIDEIVGDSKLFYTPFGRTLSANLDGNATFEEYLADENGAFSLAIAIKQSVYLDDAQLTDVMNKLSSSISADMVSILLVVIDDTEYETIDEETVRSMAVQNQYICCARYIKKDEYVHSEIKKGE